MLIQKCLAVNTLESAFYYQLILSKLLLCLIAACEDYLYLILGLDYYCVKYLSDQGVVISHRVVFQAVKYEVYLLKS